MPKPYGIITFTVSKILASRCANVQNRLGLFQRWVYSNSGWIPAKTEDMGGISVGRERVILLAIGLAEFRIARSQMVSRHTQTPAPTSILLSHVIIISLVGAGVWRVLMPFPTMTKGICVAAAGGWFYWGGRRVQPIGALHSHSCGGFCFWKPQSFAVFGRG